MVKLSTMGGKAGGKGFCLLLIESTFDLTLLLPLFSFMGVQILQLHGSNWSANKSPGTMVLHHNPQRGEGKHSKPTFY